MSQFIVKSKTYKSEPFAELETAKEVCSQTPGASVYELTGRRGRPAKVYTPPVKLSETETAPTTNIMATSTDATL